MFLNKMKEQSEKGGSFPPSSHYQTAVLAIPGPKDGGGQGGGHLHTPHSTQNITVVPVPSGGLMTAGESHLSRDECSMCHVKCWPG